jgi:hypothetical protein
MDVAVSRIVAAGAGALLYDLRAGLKPGTAARPMK